MLNFYFIYLKKKLDESTRFQKILRVFEPDSVKTAELRIIKIASFKDSINKPFQDSIDHLQAHTLLIPPVKDMRITSPFGDRRHPKTGQLEFHNGVDIGCSGDEKVYASDVGYVKEVNYNDIGGKLVIVKYDNNIICGYAHLKEVMIGKGDIIRKGTVIGLMGDTGRCTGKHLHFTIKNRDGEFINPMVFFSKIG